MPLAKLWIHCVWSTKHRLPLIKAAIRSKLFDHIIHNAEDKSIEIIKIGGWDEHVHVLLKIHPTQNLSGVMHFIKGESSHWIKKEIQNPGLFAWQDSYYAETINTDTIKAVKDYISNQEKHHERVTYKEEVRMRNKKKNNFKNS